MGSFSDYLEKKTIDHVFKTASYSPPTHIYVALCKSTISDAHTGSTLPSEISVGGYVRKRCDTWDASSATGGDTENTSAITFTTASANWGTITDFALCDKTTKGNVLGYGKLTSPVTIASGDAFVVPAGGIDVTVGPTVGGGAYGWLLVDRATRLIDWSRAGVWDAGVKGIPSTSAWTVYNVKSYGATGNGTTSDTAAIQTAINAAGQNSIIYFPAGTYLIGSDRKSVV